MFQNLRQSSQLYILHKAGEPVLDTGTVVSVTPPMPKYGIPPVYGQPQEMVVDLVVKVNGQDITYQKLPASADIADFGANGVVISDSKEAMNAEVVNLKTRSQDTINSVGFHEKVIESCNRILEGLNPEFAQRQAQQAEINDLKEQVSELVKLNKSLMERLNSGTTAAKKQ